MVSYKTPFSGHVMEGIPIITANMSSVSTFEMALEVSSRGLYCALHKHYEVEKLVKFFNILTDYQKDHIFYTLGINDYKKLEIFCANSEAPKLITIDVANGYMDSFLDFITKVRVKCPAAIILAGNVVTPIGSQRILRAGADIVKVGIGSSAVCRTRTVAGVGVPQFSAIVECHDAIKELGGLMCSDGGCNVSGDFGKAYAAGADFVMSGTMFAGHRECGGVVSGGKMQFYGMSSETAMDKHHGGMANYRASEGIVTMIDYKGSVHKTIDTILGGIASTGSYIDALNISEFYEKAHFVRANRLYNNLFGA
jgi:GMP reductase